MNKSKIILVLKSEQTPKIPLQSKIPQPKIPLQSKIPLQAKITLQSKILVQSKIPLQSKILIQHQLTTNQMIQPIKKCIEYLTEFTFTVGDTLEDVQYFDHNYESLDLTESQLNQTVIDGDYIVLKLNIQTQKEQKIITKNTLKDVLQAILNWQDQMLAINPNIFGDQVDFAGLIETISSEGSFYYEPNYG